MKKRAFSSFVAHIVLAGAYLYLVINQITLDTYILDIINLVVAVVAHILHFKWFIQYNKDIFFIPQLIQFTASTWQFVQLALIIYKDTSNKNFDVNCLFTIGSTAGLGIALCHSMYQWIKKENYLKLGTT